MSIINDKTEKLHDSIKKSLERADHYYAVTIINDEIFLDGRVEGFETRIVMIEYLEEALKKLKA